MNYSSALLVSRRDGLLVQIDMVQLGRVVADDLLGNILRDAREVLFDYIERMRPGRVGMREIRGPHETILAEEFEERWPDRIVLERRPQVAADVLTRLHLERLRHHRAELLERTVLPIHVNGDTTCVGRRRTNYDLRES